MTTQHATHRASPESPFARRNAGEPPALAVGTMNFGKRTTAAESERIVRRALERGIRVFDTANAYNGGESERILGRAIGGDRDKVVLATKVGIGLRGMAHPEGLARTTMESALAASLERLGTDRVDLYYLHAPDHSTRIEETLGAMKSFLDGGRVLAWGVSNYAAWQILEMDMLADARKLSRPAVSQVLYNVLHRQLDVDYFAFARRHPIHTSIFNPLAGGLLTGKHRLDAAPEKGSRFDGNAFYQRRYWTPAMFERASVLTEVARAEGLSLLELAYAWVASRPGVDSILIGPASVEQLDAAIDAVGRKLSPEALRRIDELWRGWMGTDTQYVR
jgi:aryl-alcohol dehydrogenase-like predicted oxidoreductase